MAELQFWMVPSGLLGLHKASVFLSFWYFCMLWCRDLWDVTSRQGNLHATGETCVTAHRHSAPLANCNLGVPVLPTYTLDIED